MNSGITGALPDQMDATARRHHRALDLHALALAAVLAEVSGTGPDWMTSIRSRQFWIMNGGTGNGCHRRWRESGLLPLTS